MKNFSAPFTKFVAMAACALTLGSCSRAEYAMLPKGSSYHGVSRVATPVPASAEVLAPAAEAPIAAIAPAAAETLPATAPVAASAPKAMAVVKTQPVATSVAKPNFVQRLALNKVTRKIDKLMQKTTARQHDNTASTTKTAAISGNLRTGLILLLVGLLVGIFNGLIGTIIALIGVIFIVLWLLDSL